MAWRVELSGPAVDALRALDKKTQRRIAQRIEHLAGGGPPPGPDDGLPVRVPADGHSLTCIFDHRDRRILVVTLRPARPSAGRVLTELVRIPLRGFRRGGGWGMEGVLRDLGYAVRRMARAPGATAVVVGTLALGIASPTAMFSVANGVLLKPLPYGDVEGVVTVWSSWTDFAESPLSEEEFLYYRRDSRALADLALYFTTSHNLTAAQDPERVRSGVVTPNLFEVLGVEPRLGRTFTWEEASQETPVVMLGDGLWRRRFGGREGVLGTDIAVNGRSYTVVGILPEGFVLPADHAAPSPSEVFFALPAAIDAPLQVPQNGGNHGYYSVGRLARGATVGEARTEIEQLSQRLVSQGVYPESWSFRPLVRAVRDDVVGTARTTILVLLGACGLVLLIACGNVANLLLARSDARRNDVGVLRALGATRRRILQQLFIESLALAALGGVLALGLSYLGLELFRALESGAIPRAELVRLDLGTLLFACLASASTVVLFGWIPAMRTAGGGDTGDPRRTAPRSSTRLQRALVATQMAMAVVLLTGSVLMMRTFVKLLDIDPGFRAERVLTMQLTAPSVAYPEATDVAGFYDELLRRIEEIPGVRRAAAARLLPLASQMGDSGVWVEGYVPAEGETTSAEWQWATPGYLEAMGIPLRRGRTFNRGDQSDAPPVIVVNESLARRYWGDRDPLGATVATFGGPPATVVGVVGNVLHNGITAESKDRYYRPVAQIRGPGTIRRLTLTIQTEGDPRQVIAPVRSVVREVDPTMPVSDVRTMDDVLASSVARPRFTMVLMGAFGGLAFLLAVVGIYGVLACAVSRRTKEIGIRMALGAAEGRVVRSVVREGMTMAILGVVVGTGLALAFTGVLRGMLYAVQPTDPFTFALVPGAFALVALVASWIPANRAARVHPSRALRHE